MIYRTGPVEKELGYGAHKHKNTLASLVGTGVFAGMLAFSVYFILQTLKRSVLADQASYYMQESYHTTLLIYLTIAYIGMTFYNIVRFRAVSFSEVYYNIWYAPLHLGYSVTKLVLSKLAVQLVSEYIITASGFVTTLAISSVMKFPFVPDYIVSMFIIAMLNTTMLLLIPMACSLLFRDISNARTMSGICAMAMVPVQVVTGFFALCCDRTRLSPVSNLFTQTGYIYIALALMGICLGICIYEGASAGKRYHPSMAQDGAATDLPEGVEVNVATASTDSFMKNAAKELASVYKPRRANGVLSVLVTALMAVIVCAMLLVDGIMLIFSYASAEKETSVLGFIPYIFQSSTMEPDVKFNDIAFFEKVDKYVLLNENEIVLYKDKVHAVQVRRILDMYYDPDTGDPMLEVDIDYYPEGSAKGLLHDYVKQEDVYGRLVGVNRWLGVVVLFANTILGRILFMLVPTVLIFYHKRIGDFFRRRNAPL